MGILGILTMPFGLDAEFWRQMGYGIAWMNRRPVGCGLPGAYGRVNASGGHRSGSVDRRRAARQRLLIPAKAGIQNWRLNFSKYWVPVYAGTSDRERAFSTAGTGRRACPGCARGWAEGYEPHRPYWLARAQSRRPGGGSA